MKKTLILLGLTLLGANTSGADVRGRVLDRAGIPVAGAQLVANTAVNTVTTTSDADGSFLLRGVDGPVVVEVHHPASEPLATTIHDGATVVLSARAVAAELDVAAEVHRVDSFAPVGFAASALDPRAGGAPRALADVLVAAPGVAENGQGGLFQVISIRGVSRQRVLTRLGGVPIVAERRAGVSTSFVDPELLGEVTVVRGPAGVIYGTGALGGLVDVRPRVAGSVAEASLGWSSAGDELSMAAGGAQAGTTWGVAVRSAGDDEDANGGVLPSHFDQYSGFVELPLGGAGELLVLGSLSEDIGKPNTRYPGERTLYPRERHVLVRADTSLGAWTAAAYLHPNDLETITTTTTSRERVENQALDLGVRTERSITLNSETELVVLGEWFGRRGVRAFEQLERCEGTLDERGRPIVAQCTTTGEAATLNRGELDEFAVASTLARSFGPIATQVGLRGAWERQDDRGRAQTDNSVAVGFLGATATLGRGFEASAHVGTGTRLPGLAERLYSGVTGAGRIVGNPNLQPERSRNYELGLRHLGRRGVVALHTFHTDVRDFIERIEIDDDLFTYRNLVEGTIEGGELEASYRFTGGWRVDASAQFLRGEDQDGNTLPDIPADRTRVAAGRNAGRLDWHVEWVHRLEKDRFGSGEAAVDGADLIAAAMTIDLRPGLALTASGRNLLDELWTPSADRRAAAGSGRSFALQVRWSAR